MDDLGLFSVEDMPSARYQEIVDVFDFPSRRKLGQMREELNALEETGSFVLSEERYGVTLISGEICESDTSGQGQLYIAGVNIGKDTSKVKKEALWEPQANLQRILPQDLETAGDAVPLESLEHGDLVSVDFETPIYGPFTILGVCTKGEKDDLLMVNKWIIRVGSGSEGLFYVEARLIRKQGEHDILVPPHRTPMVNEDENEFIEL